MTRARVEAAAADRPDREPAGPEPVPHGRVGSWLATMDPGYFAAVMATGIVGISARQAGRPLIAETLLWLTGVLFVVLLAAYLARAVRFPRRFASSLKNPSTAVAYFTLVAGTNVLGSALLPNGPWVLVLVLGIAAAVLWTILTYGLLCSVVLAGNRPLLRDINGLWLVWVVGTQSVSVLATGLAHRLPWPGADRALGVAGLLAWSVGIVLYVVLVVIIFLRLLLIETTAAEMGPAYWILMGATAISVLAAAGILALGRAAPVPLLPEMRSFIVGFAVVLWAFGTWFIPMLVLFGLWRYLVRHYPWTYDPKLWSAVFPLGMYAVASTVLGREIGFGFLTALAAGWVWIGIAAWCALVVLMLAAVVEGLRRPRATR
jgi:tellurite resistance protein TehA-like permease